MGQSEVYNVLKKDGGYMTVSQIADLVPHGGGNVNKCLASLRRRGDAVRKQVRLETGMGSRLIWLHIAL